MIVELVTFKAPPGADWEGILADARATIPRWRANRELVRKHYLLSDDGNRMRRALPLADPRGRRKPRTMRHGALASRSAPARRPRSAISTCRCCSTTKPGP